MTRAEAYTIAAHRLARYYATRGDLRVWRRMRRISDKAVQLQHAIGTRE